TLAFSRNTTVRGGPLELNWNIGLGAIWLYVLQGSMNAENDITDSNILDSTYNAFLFVADFPVKDQYNITNVHVSNVKVDGTGTSVVSARGGLGDVRERRRAQRRRAVHQQLRHVPLHRDAGVRRTPPRRQ
ncbi:MAG: hypothetical protein JWO74_3168, partial [Solirubrobacterales bacterium]|nr:hypothetical protein [Solirubrobacterales bacterium]